MTYCYTLRPLPHSALSTEASSCSRGELTQRPTLKVGERLQNTQSKWENIHPKWDVFIQLHLLRAQSSSYMRCLFHPPPSFSGLSDLWERKGRNIIRDRGGGSKENSVFQHKRTYARMKSQRLCVTAHTRPTQIQARQGPSTETRKQTRAPIPH